MNKEDLLNIENRARNLAIGIFDGWKDNEIQYVYILDGDIIVELNRYSNGEEHETITLSIEDILNDNEDEIISKYKNRILERQKEAEENAKECRKIY